jgi:REP element-mobilizing transposase RayT
LSVRQKIHESFGVYYITFTCARWLPLFEMVNSYDAVYRWFDYLKQAGHHIAGYVIMPSHVHALIAFSESRIPINTIVANGKRFMAYELVKRLAQQDKKEVLEQMREWVNKTDRLKNQQHEVFEPSFDRKECFNLKFMEQKVNYMHQNPCKAGMVSLPEAYIHSSARYYYTGTQGVYPVITYMELQDIDLTSSVQ